MTLAIVNIGDSHDGGAAGAPIPGDAIIVQDDAIAWIGDSADVSRSDHRVVIDAAGAAVIPGLIDSHVHSTFGDYTPRQKTVDFLESYVHGGTTRVISASEVHVPNRPTSVAGIKGLAIAAAETYRGYLPGGMNVHGGSVVLEPTLTRADFAELKANGVWMAKAGFGAFATARGYIPVVRDAQAEGIFVMCHTGGGSIAGSQSKINADTLLEMRPNVAGHVNGGPTALTPEENARMVVEGEGIGLQLVHAGNLRSANHIAQLALEHDCFERVLIATDTPTGTGVIPLGMLRQMAEMSSLGPLSPRQAVSAATGNVSAWYGVPGGRLAVGAVADIVVLDAPLGSAADDAFGALALGDIPSVATAITAGVVRFTKSRNTPGGARPVRITGSRAL